MQWLAGNWKKIALALGYVVLAILLDLASGAFTLQTGLAICYPPAGLYLAAILLLGWWALPLAFLNPVFSVLVTLHSPDISPAAVIGIGAASMISPTIILATLRRTPSRGVLLYTFRDVARFATVAMLAVTVESLTAASVYILTGLSRPEMFGTVTVGWWISNIIPYSTLTPVILLWYHRPLSRSLLSRRQLIINAALNVISIPLAVWIALVGTQDASVARLYVALLPILWAALVGGVSGAAWASLWLTTTVLVMAPALSLAPKVVEEAQFFLLVANLSGLVMGIVVTERRRAEEALRESAKRNQAIVENALNGIFQSTPEGRFLRINPVMAQMYGYDSPEDMVQNVTDISKQLYHEPDLRNLLQQRLAKEGRVTGFESLEQRKDGSTFWASMNIQAIYDDAGKILYYEGTVDDITQRKRADETLRTSEERYRTFIANSAEGIWRFDHDRPIPITLPVDEQINLMFQYGYLAECNDAMAHMYGLQDAKQLVGKRMDYFVSPADKANLEYLRRFIQGGYRITDAESHETDSQGHPKIFLNNMIGIVENGFLIRTWATQRDITESKRAEAEQARLISELETKNAELERFTYTVSHDLRAPLVTINGFLGFLERDAIAGNTERLKQDNLRIQEAVKKMQQLLSDLLELSRVGRLMNPPQTVAFNDIVQEALAIVQGRLEEHRVRITVQPDLPPVYGDRQRLVEVLQNLLDNASKFMGEQPEPVIEIGGREQDGKFVFFVRDNGIGIDPKYHDQVFGLFNKLDPHMEGTGVGLALVKRIIEVHGGKIWLESEPGKGATFYFTLGSEAA